MGMGMLVEFCCALGSLTAVGVGALAHGVTA